MNNLKLLPSMLVFAEVASRRSFTQAAQKLGMSKSAVSQHLARLETQIGNQLIHRNTRGMTITAAGEKLLARTELLQDQVDLAFQEMATVEASPKGVFALTFPNLLAKDIVLPSLKQLGIEYPGLSFRIIATEDPLDLIQENLDVAIFGGNLPDSGYRALPLGNTGEILCASPDYVQSKGLPNSLKELQVHQWLKPRWHGLNVEFSEGSTASQPQETVITMQLEPFIQCNSMTTLFESALQGLGIALLPQAAATNLIHQGSLVHVLPAITGRIWPFYLVHAYQEEKPVHVNRFYTLLLHYFNKVQISV